MQPENKKGLNWLNLLKKNFLFLFLLSFLLFQKLNTLSHDHQFIDIELPSLPLESVQGKPLQANELPRTRMVYILWASWCPPCKVQLTLYDWAVSLGMLNKSQVIALNLGEEPQTIQNFLDQETLTLEIMRISPDWLETHLPIMATPTIIHLSEEGIVKGYTSGLSLLGALRSRFFLDKRK